jgi:hypothetical protein
MLRHKYHIRIAKSPFEYRRKDLDDWIELLTWLKFNEAA